MSEVLNILRTRGPLPAADIGYILAMTLQDVYGHLIHAEACGMAVIHIKGHARIWEAA